MLCWLLVLGGRWHRWIVLEAGDQTDGDGCETVEMAWMVSVAALAARVSVAKWADFSVILRQRLRCSSFVFRVVP